MINESKIVRNVSNFNVKFGVSVTLPQYVQTINKIALNRADISTLNAHHL